MNRLQVEFSRLYLPSVTPGDADSLVDAQGNVRAMVLALARPADWLALARVWNGVQAELDLPAAAIAVSGRDALQLWFSLQQPLPAARAHAFLDALRLRFMSDVKPQRVGLWPLPDPAAPLHVRHVSPVPAVQDNGVLWSAFVAPDLAPMFVDEPWLDTPPNPIGQAELLSRLVCIQPDALDEALQRMLPIAAAVPLDTAPDAIAPSAATVSGAWHDPAAFLLHIMNNDSVALALRIEAAKALLPYHASPHASPRR